MAEEFFSLIDDLAVDQSPEPEAGGPVMGLVVGPALTEKQFAEVYGGKQPPMQKIIFENEHGAVETASRDRGTDP